MTTVLRIGLTGGIGSGKSTVCKMFEHLGVPVIDADVIAREVVKRGTPGLNLIQEAFGQEVITASGELDRQRLRTMIFKDEVARRRIENILHPLIWEEIDDNVMQTHQPFCIICIPLLIEKKALNKVDRILVIDTSEEQQIQRAVLRDNSMRRNIEMIMATQVGRDERLAVANDIIHNNSDIKALQAQVEKFNKFYQRISARTCTHDAEDKQ